MSTPYDMAYFILEILWNYNKTFSIGRANIFLFLTAIYGSSECEWSFSLMWPLPTLKMFIKLINSPLWLSLCDSVQIPPYPAHPSSNSNLLTHFPCRIWGPKCRIIPQECHLPSLIIGYHEEINESSFPHLSAQCRGEQVTSGTTLICVCIAALLFIIFRACAHFLSTYL